MTNAARDRATAPRFSGVIPPLVTPRTRDGDIDPASLECLVEHVLDGGVAGVFALGSSGETPYLTTAERELVLRTTVTAVAGRVPVVVGVNEQTTARVVAEAQRLADAGADALVVTSPYYALSDEREVEAHFHAAAAATALPVFAYDVPVRTHCKLAPALVERLARDGAIVGVKDSSGDDVAFRLVLRRTRDIAGFSALTGHEVCVDGAMLAGAAGSVPGLANVDPAGYVRLDEAARRGDWAAVRAEQDRLADLFAIVFAPTPGRVSPGAAGLGAFKTALALLGVIDDNAMSAPMLALDADERARVAAVLERAGLTARA